MKQPTGRWCVVFGLTGVLLFTSACDEGGAIHDRATALEAEGKRIEAADQFDLVCERAPESERCPASRIRAAELRLAEAKALVAEQKYEPAKVLLDRVMASAVPELQVSAKKLAESSEVATGLKWERAQKMRGSREKFYLVNSVHVEGGPLAAKAQAWLNTEGLPFRLDIVKEACAKPASRHCLVWARTLAEQVPKSKEGAEAQRLHDAYVTSEQVRILPVLERIEPLIAECARYWKKDKVFQAWSPEWLEAQKTSHAKHGHRPPPWSSCRNEDSLDTCNQVRQLEKRATSARAQLVYGHITAASRDRMLEACFAGAYTKQTPGLPPAADLRDAPRSFHD